MDPLDNSYFTGSQLLKNVSLDTGIPLDQLNFVATQVVALALAPVFRNVFHPSVTKPATRHAFALIIGLIFGYFAFGMQALHLAGLPSLCYVVIRTQDPHIMQRLVMAVALGYLSCIHIHRLMYDTGSYSLDVTGPLMVMTQKVTSLAFSLSDGLTKKEDAMSTHQQYYAVRKIPSLLEYFSFMLHFQSLMAGPIVFYRDYKEFIDGTHILKHSPQLANDKNSNARKVVIEPSPVYPAFKKVVISIICALIFTCFAPYLPIEKAKEEEFFERSILSQLVFLAGATCMVRFKYYHAWILADAICNLSGLGFAGYSPAGEPQWDLISNVDILDFELGLSLRDCISHWNKGTNTWLRYVSYDRLKRNATFWTYALSAIWHGFYPGYYLTFATGAIFTIASRSVRRHIRPLFLGTPSKKAFYDFVTLLVTRLVLAYTTFSFVLLEFRLSIKIYWHMFFWLHLVGIVCIYVVPKVVRQNEAQLANRLSKLVSNTNTQVNTLHG